MTPGPRVAVRFRTPTNRGCFFSRTRRRWRSGLGPRPDVAAGGASAEFASHFAANIRHKWYCALIVGCYNVTNLAGRPYFYRSITGPIARSESLLSQRVLNSQFVNRAYAPVTITFGKHCRDGGI